MLISYARILISRTTEGDEELFEKKLTKEEKKALAKAKRDAKKKDKPSKKGKSKDGDEDAEEEKKDDSADTVAEKLAKLDMDPNSEEAKQEAALEKLSEENIVVTYEQKKGALHANTRDINVGGVSVAFHGKLLVEETEVVINYGNRYGFIGPNGSGKVRERGDALF